MRLRRPLGPIRRHVRTRLNLIERRHQLPNRVDRRAAPLGRLEQIIKDPFRLHGDGEIGRVTGLPVRVGGGHGGREPGHAVEAEGPFGGGGGGGYV